jgi:hypothetical protein
VRLYLKNPITKKRAGGVAQGVGPEFKPQYHKTKKRKKKTCEDSITPFWTHKYTSYTYNKWPFIIKCLSRQKYGLIRNYQVQILCPHLKRATGRCKIGGVESEQGVGWQI